MRRLALRALALVVVIGLLGVGSYAIAGGGTKHFQGKNLNGYEENPDVSTLATGSFEGWLNKEGTELKYELSYSGLEGTVSQSHIHFGKAGVNGGISLWLCQGTSRAPAQVADTPECPTPGGTVTGTLNASDVTGPAVQLINPAVGTTPGDFAEIIAAMRAGHAYANVHSSAVGTGEIRAQINTNEGNDD